MANPIVTQEEVRSLVMRGGSLFRPDEPENKYSVAPKADRTSAEGLLFDSKAEMVCYGHLLMQERAGILFKIERQVPFDLCSPSGEVICRYFADFRVWYTDWRSQLIEVKGKETDIWKIKHKWFRSQYPDLDLKVIKRGERP